ncbi:MAG: CDP-alcohol phosphatidyltransferase family protein [Patescibacteria group bacterium]
MKETLDWLDNSLTRLNDLIERFFRFLISFFTSAKARPGSVKERMSLAEVRFWERIFDRKFLEDELLTLPNIFSLLRIPLGLTALLMIVYVIPAWVILIVHLFAILTDRIDGVLARLEEETRLGAILDPLCDKFYFGFCAIAYYQLINPWLFWIIISIEIALIAVPFIAVRKINLGRLNPDTDFRANMFGKTKFFFEITALIFLTLSWDKTGNFFLCLAIPFALFSIYSRIIKQLKK